MTGCLLRLPTIGLVVVHGIGNRRRGRTLDRMAGPIIKCVQRFVKNESWDFEGVDATDKEGGWRSTVFDERRRPIAQICAREAYWQDLARGTRGNLLWTIMSIPILLLIIAPDGRDLEAGLEEDRTALRALARLLLALASLLWLRVLLKWVLPSLGILGFIFSAIVLVAMLLALESRRINIGGQVRIASDSASADPLVERVRDEIAGAERVASSVLVVAHSQGGYLAHRALRSGSHGGTTLVGVGSGLRGIKLVSFGRTRRGLATLWLGFMGVVGFFALSVAGFVHSAPQIIRMFAPIFHLELIMLSGRGMAPDALAQFLTTLLPGFSWMDLVYLLSPFALAFVVMWVGAYLNRGMAAPGVSAIPVSRWREVTTYHDSVGRVEVVSLPDGVERGRVTLGGVPLADHVCYFARHSILPLQLAAEVMVKLERPAYKREVERLNECLLFMARRRRRAVWGSGVTVGVCALGQVMVTAPRMTISGFLVFFVLEVSVTVVIATVCAAMSEIVHQRKLINRFHATGSIPHPQTMPGGLERLAAGLLWVAGFLAQQAPLVDQALAASLLPDGAYVFLGPQESGPLTFVGFLGMLVGIAAASGYRVWTVVPVICVAFQTAGWLVTFQAHVLPTLFRPGALHLVLVTLAFFLYYAVRWRTSRR